MTTSQRLLNQHHLRDLQGRVPPDVDRTPLIGRLTVSGVNGGLSGLLEQGGGDVMPTDSERFRKLAESPIGLELEAALVDEAASFVPLGETVINLPDINNVAGYALADGSQAVMLRLTPITVAKLNQAWDLHLQGGAPKASAAVQRIVEQIIDALSAPNPTNVDPAED